MNAAAIRKLAEAGLSAAQVAEVCEAMEPQGAAARILAERRARDSARKRRKRVNDKWAADFSFEVSA